MCPSVLAHDSDGLTPVSPSAVTFPGKASLSPQPGVMVGDERAFSTTACLPCTVPACISSHLHGKHTKKVPTIAPTYSARN